MITHLTISGLKGTDRAALDLTGCDFILGDNAARKTAFFDGLALLVNGWHPAFPHTNDGVMQLASRDGLLVRARLDSGWELSRSWDREMVKRGKNAGDVRVSTTVEAVPTHDRGEVLSGKAAAAKIAALLGEPGSLDLGSFLAATDNQRRTLLLQAGARTVDWSPQRLAHEAQAHGVEGVAPWERGSLLEWIEREHGAAQAMAKAARATVASRREALAALDEESDPVDPALIGDQRTALDALIEESTADAAQRAALVQQLRGEVDAAAGVLEARVRTERDLVRVRQEEAQLRSQDRAAPAELETLRNELRALTTGWGALPMAEKAEAKARAEREAARQKLQLATDARRAGNERYTAAAGAYGEAQLKTEAMGAAAGPLPALLATVEGLLEEHGFAEAATCPTCGADLDERRKELGEAVAALRPTPAMEQAASAEVQARQVYQRADEERRAVEAAIREPSDAYAAVDAALHVAHARTETVQMQVRDLERRIEVLERKGGGDEVTRLATLAERRTRLEADLAQPVEDVTGKRTALTATEATTRAAAETYRERIAVARVALTALEKRLNAREHTAKMRARLAEAEEELERALTHERALGPKGLMGAIVAAILAPFVAAVRALTDDLGIGRFTVLMQDQRDNEVFWLGMETTRGFARVEGLSSGEQAAVHAAVLVGLATLSGAPWRPVLADHTERMDAGRRERFLRALVQFRREGKCSQVLAAGCPDIPPQVDGLAVVEV